MKLKGKAKKDFEKWYNKHYKYCMLSYWGESLNYHFFSNLPLSMQYGVLVDFFYSVGIEIQIGKQHSCRCWLYNVGLGNEESDTRNEARKAAVEKANELFNQIN